MRIVQAVGWYHPDSLGGTEIYVSSLARQLRGCGLQVVVAAPDPKITAPCVYEHDGCEVFRYPIPERPTRAEAQGDGVVRGTTHFHRWLADVRPDVVHFHTFVTGLGLPEVLAAKDAGSRVIVTTHASSLGFMCQRGTLMWQGRALCSGVVDVKRCAACELDHRGAPAAVAAALSCVPPSVGALIGRVPGPAGTALGMTDLIVRNVRRQRAMLAAVDAFVVLTERAAQMMLANGSPPAKLVVNRLGISEHDGAASKGSRVNETRRGSVRVGYVGRFEDVKGVADLAKAVLRVPADLPVHVEFHGPAQTFAERRTRADIERMFASDRRVTVGEAIAPPDLQNVLRSFDVLCCPSRCLEGGPTVGLEALAVGVPLIAASGGGVAEVLEDGVNARLVPPGDVDRLAAALVEVAGDPDGTICRWKQHLPVPRTMRDVAHDYLPLYAGPSR